MRKEVMLSFDGTRTEYEVLPPGEVIHSDFYFQQLARSQQASRKSRLPLVNRRGVIFHYENFTYHIHFLYLLGKNFDESF